MGLYRKMTDPKSYSNELSLFYSNAHQKLKKVKFTTDLVRSFPMRSFPMRAFFFKKKQYESSVETVDI